MSVGTFLKKLWNGVKKLFQGLKPELKKAIEIGATIVDNMKKFAESPAADLLTAIIPGDLDDKVKAKLRELLPKILTEMKLVESCTGLTDSNEIVACGIRTLQQIAGDHIKDSARKNFYDSLAVMIAEVAADGKLSWDDSKIILKWYYDNVKEAQE